MHEGDLHLFFVHTNLDLRDLSLAQTSLLRSHHENIQEGIHAAAGHPREAAERAFHLEEEVQGTGGGV